MEKFGKTSCPERDFAVPLEMCLDVKNLSESMKSLQKAFERADIDGHARYGLLRRNIAEVHHLVQFALYRRAKSYMELKTVVEDYDGGLKTFKDVEVGYAKPHPQWAQAFPRVMEGPIILHKPDARVSHFEDKMGQLASEFSQLALFTRQVTEPPEQNGPQKRYPKSWWYCNRGVHGVA